MELAEVSESALEMVRVGMSEEEAPVLPEEELALVLEREREQELAVARAGLFQMADAEVPFPAQWAVEELLAEQLRARAEASRVSGVSHRERHARAPAVAQGVELRDRDRVHGRAGLVAISRESVWVVEDASRGRGQAAVVAVVDADGVDDAFSPLSCQCPRPLRIQLCPRPRPRLQNRRRRRCRPAEVRRLRSTRRLLATSTTLLYTRLLQPRR